jgi:hypothetical protein
VRALPDPAQREHAFHQLQAEYLHLQQALWEQAQLLNEQRTTYHQLRLDYQAQQGLLAAEKPVRQQRQEARRWQRYSDLF